MPSFAILDWSVVRFMPNRAAAPDAPPEDPVGLVEGSSNVFTPGLLKGPELPRLAGRIR